VVKGQGSGSVIRYADVAGPSPSRFLRALLAVRKAALSSLDYGHQAF
jgi:hypothetical protein